MGVIKVNNFKKSFGSKEVHKKVTFEVQEGNCLGLIGGSGSGKSVILRTLIGLEQPDDGKVFVFDKEVSRLADKELIALRRDVAYVFQGGALFDSMTVFDNLAYPLREHTDLSEEKIEEKISKMLNDFGLAGNEHVFPAELSGGMQKRIGLARSIIMEPKIVLYDEPTAGLDPFNTKKIQEMILTLKRRGVTSILVTHDMPSAFAVCDEIALLFRGEIRVREKCTGNLEDHASLIQQFASGEVSREMRQVL